MEEPYSIILFDGECNLCNGAVDFVIRRDANHHFRYASLQSAIGRSMLKEHGKNPDILDTIILVSGKKVYMRSSAAIRVCNKLGSLWPLMNVFLIVPSPIRDVVYDWIAKNRYKWFGKRDTCRLPTAEELALFL
jgi:predicted DCC family thiol-disulfide oxidoreductase YuxK